jgi:hypothetical protein
MKIEKIENNEISIGNTFNLMKELRTELNSKNEYIKIIQNLFENFNYKFYSLKNENDKIIGLCGFFILNIIGRGKFIYVT